MDPVIFHQRMQQAYHSLDKPLEKDQIVFLAKNILKQFVEAFEQSPKNIFEFKVDVKPHQCEPLINKLKAYLNDKRNCHAVYSVKGSIDSHTITITSEKKLDNIPVGSLLNAQSGSPIPLGSLLPMQSGSSIPPGALLHIRSARSRPLCDPCYPIKNTGTIDQNGKSGQDLVTGIMDTGV